MRTKFEIKAECDNQFDHNLNCEQRTKLEYRDKDQKLVCVYR